VDEGTDDAVVAAPLRVSGTERVLRIAVPVGMLLLAILAWHLLVTIPGTIAQGCTHSDFRFKR
jgi:NitT/TauT family transport system permease protein